MFFHTSQGKVRCLINFYMEYEPIFSMIGSDGFLKIQSTNCPNFIKAVKNSRLFRQCSFNIFGLFFLQSAAKKLFLTESDTIIAEHKFSCVGII